MTARLAGFEGSAQRMQQGLVSGSMRASTRQHANSAVFVVMVRHHAWHALAITYYAPA